MPTTTDTLKHLVETVENGRRGYAEGADKLQKDGHADVAATFKQFSVQRAEFARDLRALDANLAVESDDDGTTPGALHRGWLALKDALSGDSPKGVLDVAEQGEDHALKEYQEALNSDLPAPVRTVVARQLTEIEVAHRTVKRLRDQN